MFENSDFEISKLEEIMKNETCVYYLTGPNTTDVKPFLFKTLEELSEVKSTQFWRNDKVRVLGKMFLEKEDCFLTARLLSPLNSSLKSFITLDVDEMNCNYASGKLVEVFGYFSVDMNDGPQLKAVHITPANGINIQAHYEVIKLRNKYVPECYD